MLGQVGSCCMLFKTMVIYLFINLYLKNVNNTDLTDRIFSVTFF